MEIEIRSDSISFSGYVNVTGKMSKPVITPDRQRVIETIEERAFSDSLKQNPNVEVWLDHNKSRVVASTADGTLEAREDAIGLKVNGTITDPEVVANAKKLTGWSMGMRNVKATIEERANDLPLRHIKSLDLDHIALLLHKSPAYSATSIELRDDEEKETEVEVRSVKDITVTDKAETPEKADLSQYQNRINHLRVGK